MRLVEAVNDSNIVMLKDIVSANDCTIMIPIIPVDDEALNNLFTQLYQLGFEWSSGNSLIVVDKVTLEKRINNFSIYSEGTGCYYIYEDKTMTYGSICNIPEYEVPVNFVSNMIIKER